MSDTIGFIGLGVMGRPMARNLLEKGFEVVVTTSSVSKADEFRSLGAKVVDTTADVAASARVIFSCVPDGPAVLGMINGRGGLATSDWSGGLLVDCSTIASNEAQAAADAISLVGGSFVDAPITGGKKGAEDGTLTIMCGGDASDIKRATPAMEAMGKRIFHVGPVGAGQTVKSCNQMMVSINYLAACEAIALARANGVDPRVMREVVLTGTGRSGALENNALRYLDGALEPGFRIELMKKDIGIANAVGREKGLVQPGTNLMLQLLQMAINNGLGDLDTAALGKLYEKLNGEEA